MKLLKGIIIHPFLFALFPILALLAYNITEVDPRVAVRSIVISLIGTIILLILIFLLTRSWKKAGLAATLFLVLFFSYGQVYEFLQQNTFFGFSFGRHRFLILIYLLLLFVGMWSIFRKSIDLTNATLALNVVAILLLIFPLFQIANFTIHALFSEYRLAKISPNTEPLIPANLHNLPDIYFIILDGYTRSDALLNDYGFDNSTFLDNLRSMGFYVADCSRANNTATPGALEITLNMNYLPALRDELTAQGMSQDDIGIMINQSQVRKLLESIGYKTVAFDSGFEWSRLPDADVYLQYAAASHEIPVLQPFEAMLIRSTALLVWFDKSSKSILEYTDIPFTDTSFPIKDHINRQLFILDQLPRLPYLPGPKLVFAHIIIPHGPLVFEANGEITTDPGFYGGKLGEPVDDQHLAQGYVNEVQFINSRITGILRQIITESEVPPIIVMMGDHGLRNDNRYENLNSYYLPGIGAENLYSTISPVNSFRVIFNTYFGTHYDLLPDGSYDQFGVPVPETSQDCLQQ
jgi:hypothetical protein